VKTPAIAKHLAVALLFSLLASGCFVWGEFTGLCQGPSCTVATKISAGGEHTCLVRHDRSAACWGSNRSSQLGIEMGVSIEAVHFPTTVSGLSDVSDISAGRRHTCAINADTIYCWGDNDRWQSGLKPKDENSGKKLLRPTAIVSTAGRDWKMVSSGGAHTCALTTAGAVWCWGDNRRGQVDTTLPEDRVAEPMVKKLGKNNPMLSISAGLEHTCVHNDENIYCWGNPSSGKTGRKFNATDGEFEDMEPSQVSRQWSVGKSIVDLDSGREHTCALVDDGEIYCWGSSKFGQFDSPNTSTSAMAASSTNTVPIAVVENSNMQQIRSGRFHTCAVSLKNGEPYCWGGNRNSQLGDDTTEDRFEPRPVQGPLTDVQQLSVGGEHACVLKRKTGDILCWGLNDYGQAGQPWVEGSAKGKRTVGTPTPITIPDPDAPRADASVSIIPDTGADSGMMFMPDSGMPGDVGFEIDSGPVDSGGEMDATAPEDSGLGLDASAPADADMDSGFPIDAGTNTPPTQPSISIEPSNPTPLDDLSCTITSSSTDAQSHPITYAYAWTRNTTTTTLTTSTVGFSLTDSGDTWTCRVTPHDGMVDGPAGTATATVSVPLDSCASILTSNSSAPDDIYLIDPDGPGGQPAFTVYCQMTKGGIEWVQSTVNDLWFNRSEVTTSQYGRCINAGSCSLEYRIGGGCSNLAGDETPMTCVKATAGGQFCAWVGGRLPTESEWYIEASNNQQHVYPWGNAPEPDCNYCVMDDPLTSPGCGASGAKPVCSKPMGNNVSGLCDLAGNVMEWTSTIQMDQQFMRGGAWTSTDSGQLRADRSYPPQSIEELGYYSTDLGFRCVSASLPGTTACAVSESYGVDCWPIVPTRSSTCSDRSVDPTPTCPGTAGSATCASTAFCGQDAQYPDLNVQNFVCLNAQGQDILCPPSSTAVPTVRDDLTGLIWQRSQSANSSNTWADANDYCAALTTGNQVDWRLPNVQELRSLVDYGRSDPAIDLDVFPGTASKRYWTSLTIPNAADRAFTVNFDTGQDWFRDKNPTAPSNEYVRCVRSPSTSSVGPDNRFIDTLGYGFTGDRWVTDSLTGLTWNLSSITSSNSWEEALAHCEGYNLFAFDKWRLPSVASLASLVNNARSSPASDFRVLTNVLYWSSTHDASDLSKAWTVHFGNGGVIEPRLKTLGYTVLCVY
jgi:alpha-tubulin suppressor-like RCC1 family protein/formylglycine-generating enzyme required for sulfatase activity